MEFSLHYGQGSLTVDIPQANTAGFIQPRHIASSAGNALLLWQAIDPKREKLVRQTNGRCVGVLLPDGTRDLPLNDISPLLLPALADARKILFFICTGTHSAGTSANHKIIRTLHSQAARAHLNPYEIILHDCQQASFSTAGLTQRGTQVLYNSRLDEADLLICLSDVKHHYFAGYSNPIKNIAPGLCAFKTTEQNHSWTMHEQSRAGFHPWHANPSRRDNPLACDLLEAMDRIVQARSVWALTTISTEGAVQWADFGPARTVCQHAFEQADDLNVREVESVEFMIVSPGGLPNDIDLYIAQRALELTHTAVADGGQILFLAACPDGIGSPRTVKHFERVLMEPLDAILGQRQSDYHLFSHKPYRFAQLLRRLNRLWFQTEIDAATVRKIHMHPCTRPQQVVDNWLAQKPKAKILVVDGANKLLLQNRIPQSDANESG
jgi:nickel-dependent lactate racemase